MTTTTSKLFSSILLISTCAWAAEVTVTAGKISGKESDGIQMYKGIPFAAPPVGELRWKAPQPVAHWDGVRACEEFSAACPQPNILERVYGTPLGEMSEDCLYLNVWTPAKSPTEKYAVMVWLHGGGNVAGSGNGPLYDGVNLAKQGVVLVTVNYRLGVFGFFGHKELSAESEHGVSGNYGLLDQIAALQWVRDNIAAFGGDPRNVTLFGESAGAQDTCILMTSPLAKGLFHRAIAESGSAFGLSRRLKSEAERASRRRSTAPSRTPFDIIRQRNDAGGDGSDALETLGQRLMYESGAKSLAELRAVDWKTLLDKTGRFTQIGAANREMIGPVIDGHVIPDRPASIFRAGKQADVPIIVGANADEGTIFTAESPIKAVTQWKASGLTLFGGLAPESWSLYPAEKDQDVAKALADLTGDMTFVSPARRLARMMEGASSNAWLYHFTKKGDSPMAQQFGAFHGSEIPYVFKNLTARRAAANAKDDDLARVMSGYWTNFAKTGNPNGQGLPEWPTYEMATDRYIELGDTVEAKAGLRKEKLDFFDKVFEANNP